MSYLRGSGNYVWCTTSVLGKGATGAVFQGVSKMDGEPVAVKTFNQLSHMRPQEVQMREFEVLKKVKHENIVKLLAIEEEQDSRGKVIVMELCTGGSLFSILDDPENTYGLHEEEFLLVLGHLSAGMKHLRDLNLVHRDLKPGNIMKYISEDGRVIYKLVDFGAARELEDDQEFVSLYGTEEYLHPDLYERAVLRKPVGKTFSASVDLWSIGVTLFHIATGQLPFRPYGGRKNKEMMYYITTKKESGVISGCQSTENGPIEWKRDLPNCQLSFGLKLIVTSLLGGLMEVDTRKRLSFDNFFSAVTNLLQRKRVCLFYVNKVQSLRIYMDVEENKSLNNFQCLVMEQTDISPENQIILFKDKTLQSLVEECSTNGEFKTENIPDTTDDTPIILFNRENNNISLDWETKDLPKFSSFPGLVNVENDASLAKNFTAIGFCFKRRIEKIVLSVNLINKSVRTIVRVIVLELTVLSKETDQVQSVIQNLGQMLSLMGQFQRVCQSFIGAISSSPPLHDKLSLLKIKADSLTQASDNFEEDFRGLTSHLLTIEQPIKQLYNRFCENNLLMTEWEEAVSDLKDISRSSIRAATYVSKLRDSWQHLLRDRATRNLTYNDEQFHILERIKMQEKAKCLTEQLTDCQLVIVRLTEILSDWYKTTQAAFIQTEILAKDLYACQENMQSYLLQLNDVVENYQTDLDSLVSGLLPFQQNAQNKCSNSNNNNNIFKEREHDKRHGSREKSRHSVRDYEERDDGNGSIDDGQFDKRNESPKDQVISRSRNSSRRDYVKTFNKGLRELTNVQEEVWTILKENADLVNQFQTLTLNLLSEGNNSSSSFPSTPRSSLTKNDSKISGKSN